MSSQIYWPTIRPKYIYIILIKSFLFQSITLAADSKCINWLNVFISVSWSHIEVSLYYLQEVQTGKCTFKVWVAVDWSLGFSLPKSVTALQGENIHVPLLSHLYNGTDGIARLKNSRWALTQGSFTFIIELKMLCGSDSSVHQVLRVPTFNKNAFGVARYDFSGNIPSP